MSDEQNAAFDKKTNEVIGAEGSNEEDLDNYEIGAKALRRRR